MQKVVLKVDIDDNVNSKRKAMKLVSSIAGLESISMDMKDKKLTVTVIGDMDPMSLVEKLRKNYRTEIISVGPAKEPKKPKEEPKKPKEESKKLKEGSKNPKEGSKKPKEESKKPQSMAQVTNFVHSRYRGYYISVEEDPNGCVIC